MDSTYTEENPLADPVAVIVTLQQYKKMITSQIERLRQDIQTSKTFQMKYGPSAWKQSLGHLNKALAARTNMLKEVQFQLDLVAAGVRQGRGLCQKLNQLVGPPEIEVDVTLGLSRTVPTTPYQAAKSGRPLP